MIYLITGKPGDGKTLYALKLAEDFKLKGRRVYSHGVPGEQRDTTGFHELPDNDPTRWEELPDNSVVLIDECYSAFPTRSPGSKKPGYVEALARHRHRGFDFILIAQGTNQLDSFLKGLVHEHYHVRNKFGTKRCIIKVWDACCDQPLKATPLKSFLWTREERFFTWYTSATMHTGKRSFPWYFYALPIVLAFTLAMVWKASTAFRTDPAEPSTSNALPPDERALARSAGGGGFFGGGDGTRWLSTEDYARDHLPRIPLLPWSAPIFDGREATAHPQVFCISSAVRCHCVTEQGTPYQLEDHQCRYTARWGGQYNPYKQPQDVRHVEPAAVSATQPARPSVRGTPALDRAAVRSEYRPPALERVTGRPTSF